MSHACIYCCLEQGLSNMNIVKWITDSEVELSIDDLEYLKVVKSNGIKLFKHPVNGARRSDGSYYIRYNSNVVYTSGSYSFPENPVLQELCLILHQIGFLFWGSFKTEISPYDYMRSLQHRNLLQESFRYIQAGENTINVFEYEQLK